ncbi:MAG: head-tail connector protein [Devosia sp.]
MTSNLLAGPAEEPLALAEAKAWLRLDGDDEDALVATLVAAARLHVESTSRRALIAQSWRLVLDRWPESRIVRLPVSPLLEVTSITAYDPDGVASDVSLEDITEGIAELILPATLTTPMLREHNGIAIDYVAGYAEAAAGVPDAVKQALKLLIAYWFEHRDTVFSIGEGPATPLGFDALVAPYRTVRL